MSRQLIEEAIECIVNGNNNEQLQRATSFLGECVKNVQTVPILFQIMLESNKVQVQRLAAILLRQHIGGLWIHLSEDVKEHLKNSVLELASKQENWGFLKSVCDVIFAIMKITDGEQKNWDKLVPFLFEMANGKNPIQIRASLYLFDILSEQYGDKLRDHTENLFGMYSHFIKSEDPNNRYMAIKAAGNLLTWLQSDEQIEKYRTIVELMVMAIQDLLKNGNNNEAVESLTVLIDLISCPLPIVSNYIQLLSSFTIEITKAQNLNINVRFQAISVIYWIIREKKNLVKDILPEFIKLAFALILENDVNQDDESEDSIHKFSMNLIKNISLYFTFDVYNLSMDYITKFVESEDPNYRKGAITALMALSEHCGDIFKEKLEPILEYVLKGMRDPDLNVRKVSYITLGQFSEYLQPEITAYHEKIMPMIVESLNEKDNSVLEKSCYALVTYASNSEEDLTPYSDVLMNKLMELIKVPNTSIQEMVLSAISAIAIAVETDFQKYYKVIFDLIKQLMNITDPSNLSLRCNATECAGVIALAIGREAFNPYLEFFINSAIQGIMQPELEELREYAYGFLANMAELLRNDFKPYLNVVVPLVLKGCYAGDDKQEEVDELLQNEEQDQISSFVEEKTQALHAISVMALALGNHYLEYVNESVNAVIALLSHDNSSIRKAAVQPSETLIITINQCFPAKNGKWVSGVLGKEQPLSNECYSIINTFIPLYIQMLISDPEKAVVTAVCETLKNLVNLLGPGAFDNYIQQLVDTLKEVINKVPAYDLGEEENLFNEDEESLVLFIEACAVLVALAKAYKSHFYPFFDVVELLDKLYMHPQPSFGFRFEASGTIAEIIQFIGPTVKPKLEYVFDLIKRGLNDQYCFIKSNFAFLSGVLCENCGSDTYKYYELILNGVSPLFKEDMEMKARDNAVGCVARLMMANPNNFPYKDVLPTFFSCLPLVEDMDENIPTYAILTKLTNERHQEITQYIPQIIDLFSHLLGEQDIQEEVQKQLAESLSSLFQAFPKETKAIVDQLTNKQQKKIQKYVKK